MSDKKSRKTVLNFIYPEAEKQKHLSRYNTAILCDKFTYNKLSEQRYRARDAKEARITRHVALAPEVTKEIHLYCKEQLFPKYVFFDKLSGKGKRRGTCSNCGKTYNLVCNVRHKSEYTCPKCGVTAFLWAKHHITTAKNNTLLTVCDKIDEQLLIATYEIKMWYEHDMKPRCQEYLEHVRINPKDERKDLYTYKWRYVQYFGWGWGEDKYNSLPKESVVYPCNLREVFGNKYCGADLQETFENCNQLTSPEVNFINLLENLKTIPQAEYIVKHGLVKIASQMKKENFSDGKSLESVLGISKQLIPLYQKYNLSLEEHEIVRAVIGKVDETDINQIRKIAPGQEEVDLILELLREITLKKLLNYIVKQKTLHPKIKYSQLLFLYRDYFTMCADLEIASCSPKDLKKVHDELAKQVAEIQNEIDDKKLKKVINELYTDSMNFRKNGLAVVLPMSRYDFVKEGQELSHCVGSSGYFKDHINGRRMIFFIRKESALETSFVTLSVNMLTHTLSQCLGAMNKEPSKEVKKFAVAFIKHLKKSKEKVNENQSKRTRKETQTA